jgi:hypothetical protein
MQFVTPLTKQGIYLLTSKVKRDIPFIMETYMSTEISYSPRADEKRELWSMKINRRLKYLARIASREQQRTISNFVERAIERALTVEAMREQEPNVGAGQTTKQSIPLWREDLWSADEAERFYRLATRRPGLLSKTEREQWGMLSGSMVLQDGKISLKRFREYWNDGTLNTEHILADLNGGK